MDNNCRQCKNGRKVIHNEALLGEKILTIARVHFLDAKPLYRCNPPPQSGEFRVNYKTGII